MESFPFASPESIGVGAVAAIAIWVLYKLISKMIKVLDDRNDVDKKLAVSISENTQITKDTNHMIQAMTSKIEQQSQTIEKQNAMLDQHSKFFELLINSQMKKV